MALIPAGTSIRFRDDEMAGCASVPPGAEAGIAAHPDDFPAPWND
jgi:hypothetical protein